MATTTLSTTVGFISREWAVSRRSSSDGIAERYHPVSWGDSPGAGGDDLRGFRVKIQQSARLDSRAFINTLNVARVSINFSARTRPKIVMRPTSR